MPNWTSSYVTITPKASDVNLKEVVDLLTDEDGSFTMNKFIKMPEELVNNDAVDWAYNNWGVKWDASEGQIDYDGGDSFSITFMTPWSFPVQFFETLTKKFNVVVNGEIEDEGEESWYEITVEDGKYKEVASHPFDDEEDCEDEDENAIEG